MGSVERQRITGVVRRKRSVESRITKTLPFGPVTGGKDLKLIACHASCTKMIQKEIENISSIRVKEKFNGKNSNV